MRYPIAIEPAVADHAYGVVVPDLPGCFSAGDTLDEAFDNAKEAVELWLEEVLDDGGDIPAPRTIAEHQANPEFAGWAWAVVTINWTPIPEGKVLRYESTTDCSEEGLCDVVWVDRLTGKEVFRYDGADPANTNAYYSAPSDEECFAGRGLDLYALIDKAEAKPVPRFPVFDDYEDYDG